ncbi:MAG: hypothetical protein HZB45_14685 [Mycolicibacterium rufum]|uniref:Uncharacterized protein n=1 Tax=Mycolicibacterium chlorophenolicum TaxID=37916 RepID=A0A0J6VG30_9MYCO|nr:hypothetical protein [Mycolicibacterium chlorophenolicum]KMO69965.1 hypothetical protein MCHLDSM_04848 [Mycolicibacterium chlorophenolicum]MBI5338925.1 hypothetical protein [Mycolicibacterium rufum]
MTGLVILAVGGVMMIAVVVVWMVRVDQASQRKLDLMRAQWEAEGREGPCPGLGSWS